MFSKNRFFYLSLLLFIGILPPSVFSQKLVKIGYSLGNFSSSDDHPARPLNVQSIQLSYEKGSRKDKLSWGLTVEYMESALTYTNWQGRVFPFSYNAISIEPELKYYIGEKTNSLYVGLGVPMAVSEDFLSGLALKTGFQKRFAKNWVAHFNTFARVNLFNLFIIYKKMHEN